MPELWLIIIIVAICVGIGLFLQWLIFRIIRLSPNRKSTVLKAQILKHLKTPFKFLLPILIIYSALSSLELSFFWQKLIEVAIIINLTWILLAFMQVIEVVVNQKFQVDGNIKSKKIKALTQLRFLKSLSFIIIITLAIASILRNIPKVKKIGTTILTSAGRIGIIVGVAAQKSITCLITGFQVAFTQPIKIDDEVVIEGEFVTAEDITLTYAVVKTWGWQRLVLPLNYFNDKPFINWSFNSADIIGSVFLYVDYSFLVKDLKKELTKFLEKHPEWYKKMAELLVTKTDKKTIELRATFSAKSATDIWNLRCAMRKELMAFIQKRCPASLPKLRRMEAFKI